MISRTEYNEALTIVEQYHKQLLEIFLMHKNKNWEELTIGDFVIFDKSLSKNIIPNKPYQVTYVSPDWKQRRIAYYGIMGENGKEKWMRKFANGYRVRLT